MPTVSEVARITLKNILFPTDFSPASDAALPFALALARIYGSTILLAHILPAEPHLQVVLDRVPAQDDEDWQRARQKLVKSAQDPAMGNTPHRVLLDRGDLADVIPAMVCKQEVDMVVLGTHGRRGVSKLVMGSGAEKIYRSAPCPVLTVGPRAQKKGADWKLQRILCPVEIAENTEPAVHYAFSLAEENESQILLMQAVPMVPWQHRVAVEHDTRRALEALIPVHAEDWCRPDFLVRWEHPAEAIVQAAADREADLIVLGVRKARAAGFSAHLPWPVASEVVSRASCPVLTVRV